MYLADEVSFYGYALAATDVAAPDVIAVAAYYPFLGNECTVPAA